MHEVDLDRLETRVMIERKGHRSVPLNIRAVGQKHFFFSQALNPEDFQEIINIRLFLKGASRQWEEYTISNLIPFRDERGFSETDILCFDLGDEELHFKLKCDIERARR